MKKKVTVLILCVLSFSLSACHGTTESSNGKAEEVKKHDLVEEVTEGGENKGDENEQEEINEYEKTEVISDYEIYLNYKEGKISEVGASCYYFANSGTDMALFLYCEEEFTGDYTNVCDFLNDGRIGKKLIRFSNAEFLLTEEYLIDVAESQHVTINERDCINFTGSITDANGRVCFSYGYTFVIQDMPCMLVGFVFTKEQLETEIEGIKTEIDTMMGTVRTVK